MARRPGDNQQPAPDARGRRQPYPRIKPDLHRATSRVDPLPADVVHDYGDDGRNLDTPTSRIPPGSGNVFGAGAGPRDDARLRQPGGDETPVRGPLSRLDVPTSRQDPLAPYNPTDPAMRSTDDATSRADPVTVTVHIVPLVQGRRARHHQPYTTGQRGPHQ